MTITVYFAIPGDLYSLTGGYGYDRRLIAGLRDAGIAVQLIHLANSFPAPDKAALEHAEAHLAQLPDGAILLVDGLALGAMDASAIAHGHRLNIIALCHHPLALETGLSPGQQQDLQRSEKRALDAATAILVTSSATCKILHEQFAIPSAKITVAVPGTDRQPFATCGNHPPILLTVASLTQRKAHDILIAALATLAHLPWQARFVGGAHFAPQWTSYLQGQVIHHKLEDRIHFVGSLENLTEEYSQADIFVLPSLFEGYGMAFAEALAFGLPVIAAATGALPDVIPATAGILVPPSDTAALAIALTQLLTQPQKRRQLQLGAQQAAQNLPRWEATCSRVAELIITLNSSQFTRKYRDNPL